MQKVFLLADDDIDDKALFAEAIESIDATVLCHYAEDGTEVLSILNKSTPSAYPHMIFLDVNMPIMNGWDCLKELKKDERYRDIPVVVYSTSSHQIEVNIAFKLGAICFFTKPATFKELKAALHIIVANYGNNLLNAILEYNRNNAQQVFFVNSMINL